MKNIYTRLIWLVWIVLFLFSITRVEGKAQTLSETGDTELQDRLLLATSLVNIARSKKNTYDLRVEYHFGTKSMNVFRHYMGMTYSFKKDAYFYGGTGAELYFNKHLYLQPSLAVGYFKQGKGVELGFPIEFREGVELVWKINPSTSVFLGVFHMSNADLSKLKKKPNPGVEMLSIGISIPIFAENQLS